jgi:hypothetical protein
MYMRPLFQNVDCSCDAQANSFNGRKGSSGQVDSRFEIPITLLSANGPFFASKCFQVLIKVLAVKHVWTSAYRPTTNGQVERWNATFVDTLAHFAREKDFDLYLDLAFVAYNSSVHATTGYAPLEFSMTREPAPSVWSRQPSLFPRGRDEKRQYRQTLLSRAARLCESEKETTHIRLERYKYLYDYLWALAGTRGSSFSPARKLLATRLGSRPLYFGQYKWVSD